MEDRDSSVPEGTRYIKDDYRSSSTRWDDST